MRSLPKPSTAACDVYYACNSRLRNQDLKQRLDNFVNQVSHEANQFDTAAIGVKVHLLPLQTLAGAGVTREELVAVYNDRMAHQAGPGREFYLELRSSSPQDECPLCAHGDVKTLDHYLPKQQFPILAVVPFNLVPSCADCNKEKLSVAPTSAGEELFHPYYNNIDNDRWLYGNVVHVSPPAVIFEVRSPAIWTALQTERIVNHFNTLNLGRRYSTQAARLVNGIKLQVQRIFDANGTDGVREHLAESADSREAINLNSWQSATYRALAASTWYCTGGFL